MKIIDVLFCFLALCAVFLSVWCAILTKQRNSLRDENSVLKNNVCILEEGFKDAQKKILEASSSRKEYDACALQSKNDLWNTVIPDSDPVLVRLRKKPTGIR